MLGRYRPNNPASHRFLSSLISMNAKDTGNRRFVVAGSPVGPPLRFASTG
jgi:hypothetical protein